jgi:hypothetical protein
MATAITEDFVTKNGIVIQGNSDVTSSTNQANALQVGGGAAIASNLIVGTTASIWGPLTVFGKVTATNVVSITNNTTATTSTKAGALIVTGGIYANNNIIVAGTNANTSTITDNALYVLGGVGINGSLLVNGPAFFNNDVVFTGNTAYIYSTNTVYTDNLIELHTPINDVWTVNDGRDIGIRFHYYNSGNQNGALVLSNNSKYLEWYDTGAESNTGTFVGASYGTFKTGSIILTSATNATSTNSGALQVVGGLGINGAIYSGNNISGDTISARNLTKGRVVFVGDNGTLIDQEGFTYNTLTNLISVNVLYSNTATNLLGGARGSIPYQTVSGVTTFLPIGFSGQVLLSENGIPTWGPYSDITSGRATTATNLGFGSDTLIPFQNGVGSTIFEGNFAYDYNADTLRTVNAVFSGTTNASSTISGAVQVIGGIGVGGSIYLGGDILTNNSSFNLINTNAITVNFAGAATAITIGSVNGYTAINNLTTLTNTTNSISTSSGALVVKGGVGIVKDIWIGGSVNANTYVGNEDVGLQFSVGATEVLTIELNTSTFTRSTNAISTESGALVVKGGVGIGGNVFIGGITNVSNNIIPTTSTVSLGTLAHPFADLYLGPNSLNIDTIKLSGVGSTLTVTSTLGSTVLNVGAAILTTTTNATTTTSGALQVAGGVGIVRDLWVGGNETILGDLEVRGGDITTDQTTFNLLNATASTINFAGAGTAITIGTTTGYTEIKHATTITSITESLSTNSGALQVRGGSGIGGNLYVGGDTILHKLTATITTVTSLTVSGTAAVGGILSVTEGSNSNAIGNGAVRITGGVGVSLDVVVGGLITSGVTQAQSVGTTVPGVFSNNTLIASFTSNTISGNSQVNLDTFSSILYRSARYFVQIVDGFDVHISEISLFHDGVKAYINEYGISTNNGQLGVFDATWDSTNVTVKFKPNSASSMVIKMSRITITA